MAKRPSRLRRALLGIAAVAAIASLVVLVVLIRRDHDRQQLATVRRTLGQLRRSGGDPVRITKQWPRLRVKLQREIDSDPGGSLAVLAYRAASPLRVRLPVIADASKPVALQVHYGDPKIVEAVVADHEFRWRAELEASWDGGDWQLLHRQSWTPDEAPSVQLDLRQLLDGADFAEGEHTVSLRALCSLWLDPAATEDDPVLFRERRDLGDHALRIGRPPRPTAAARGD